MRNIKNPSTKEKLLDTSIGLMLKKGFTATSVDEICQTAGLTKGSFFHYFESKEDLADAALHRFWQSQIDMLETGSFNTMEDPLECVYGYVDFFAMLMKNPDVPKSCLVGNLTQELSKTHPQIRTVCSENFSWHVEMLKQMLDKAKERYAKNADFDTKSLAEHFVSIIQGSFILAKAKQEDEVAEKNIAHFRRYLEMLFSNSKTINTSKNIL